MNTKISKFVWQDSYSVGDPVLDQQHQRIIEILNLLHDLLHSDATGDDFHSGLRSIFAELHAYVQGHFGYEEERMLASGYPAAEFAAHQRSHRALIERVQAFEDAIASGSDETIAQILPYLYGSWLIEHICGTDHDYAPWLGGGNSAAA